MQSSENAFNSAAANENLSPLSQKLVAAALAHSVDDVFHLLRHGACPDTPVPDFGPVLIYAVRQGNAALVQCAAEAGARLDQPDAGGVTALMWAAHYGLEDISACLLEQGADPLLRDKTGQTARDKAKQAADDMDVNDGTRSVEDIETSFNRLTRVQAQLKEAEGKYVPGAFHEGLSGHLLVGVPLKFKAPPR